MKGERTGFERIRYSVGYSLKGLIAAFRNEEAFRQELILCIIMTPFAWWIGDNAIEWLLLVGTCIFVLIIELLNSAIESVVDRIGLEHHELSGRAKDIGSAAVMLSLIMAGITWGLLAWDKFVPATVS